MQNPPGKVTPKSSRNVRSWRLPQSGDSQAAEPGSDGGGGRRAAGGALHELWAGLYWMGRTTPAIRLRVLRLRPWSNSTAPPLRFGSEFRPMRPRLRSPDPGGTQKSSLNAHTKWRLSAGVARRFSPGLRCNLSAFSCRRDPGRVEGLGLCGNY